MEPQGGFGNNVEGKRLNEVQYFLYEDYLAFVPKKQLKICKNKCFKRSLRKAKNCKTKKTPEKQNQVVLPSFYPSKNLFLWLLSGGFFEYMIFCCDRRAVNH